MEIISRSYEFLYNAIGIYGIVLLSCLLVLFVIQLYYYIGIYGRIPKYRNKINTPNREVEGISVVVVVHQNYHFLENTLPLIMGQDYQDFELVVVDVGSDEDYDMALANLKGIYPNLVTTKFEEDSRFAISNKMALNVGIKAACYPFVVITTTDAYPASERWLSLTAKCFAKGDVVLGYCGLEKRRGLANKLMRTTRMMTGVNYLSSAIKNRPYRGLLQNLGLSRKLYFDSRGFDHLNMNIGEDDLYIQNIATKNNSSVMMHPNATTTQYSDGGMRWWRRQRCFLGSTYKYYRVSTKISLAIEPLSRVFFFLCVIYSMIVFPNEIRIAVGAVWFLRLAIVEHYIFRIGKRLGENGLAWTYPLHDLWAPFDQLWLFILGTIKPVRGIWR